VADKREDGGREKKRGEFVKRKGANEKGEGLMDRRRTKGEGTSRENRNRIWVQGQHNRGGEKLRSKHTF